MTVRGSYPECDGCSHSDGEGGCDDFAGISTRCYGEIDPFDEKEYDYQVWRMKFIDRHGRTPTDEEEDEWSWNY